MELLVNNNEIPSIINDPFKSTKIVDIMIRFRVSAITEKQYWYAVIDFENGRTKGQQKTPDCADFKEVMIEVNKIIQSTK